MDDIMKQLTDFLSTEGGQNALKEISSIFESEEKGEAKDTGGMSDLMGSLSSLLGSGEKKEAPKDNNSFDSGEIIKLLSMFSQMKENDDSRLLLALKPYLKGSRREKVDQAVKILKLMEMLPILKESGILSSFL